MSVLYNPTDVAIGQRLRGLDDLFCSFDLQTHIMLCDAVSIFTLWTFDYIINLEDEVSYLFGAKLSISKCTYLVCRYTPFILLGVQWPLTLVSGLSMKTCPVLFQIHAWLILVILFAVECVFLLRTYALWGCNKRIFVVLLSGLVITLVSAVAVLETYQVSIDDLFSEPPVPVVGSCYKSELPPSTSLCFILLLVFETEVFLFTIYRARVHYRRARSRLLEVLIQHSIFFYAIALVLALTNTLAIFLLPSYYSEAFGAVQALAQALLATRMQLSLWKADRRDVPLSPSGVPGITLVFRPATVLEEL
ncbi:hypothetical protein BV22DRAFT_73230 [Leucogyrophana mollusca]|uniref:Uncharacterized protein n=1 Tax=Leucogyrophana mollusca TaxID=85980 RepID=A0ACB8BWH2_9AGAM|nr:hypothetical protein BV22DRAFT_73230 [Leucogyrophana mollusca]